MGKNVETSVMKVRLGDVQPDQGQPRQNFDPAALEQLAESLKSNGLLQPIVVRPNPNCDPGRPKYLLIAGERRWRAAVALGWETIPAIVRKGIGEAEAAKLQLLENIVRRDLDAVETARAFEKLLAEGMPLQELAEAVGMDPARVEWHVEMLRARPDVLDLVARGHLKPWAAHDLGRLTPDGQGRALRAMTAQKLNTREIIAVAERIYADEHQMEAFTELKLSETQTRTVHTFKDAFRQLGALLTQLQEMENRQSGAIAQALAAEANLVEAQLDQTVLAIWRIKKALQVNRVQHLVEVS